MGFRLGHRTWYQPRKARIRHGRGGSLLLENPDGTETKIAEISEWQLSEKTVSEVVDSISTGKGSIDVELEQE